MRSFLIRFATFFGIGKLPKAPGTWGSLAALPLAYGLNWVGPLAIMVAVAVFAILGVLACEFYEQDFGGHDHPEIVIDEVVGILITMTWLPNTWQAYLVGFLAFRVLDIWKPFPIGYLDKKVPGGIGVMADDIAAGILANIGLQLLYTNTYLLGARLV